MLASLPTRRGFLGGLLHGAWLAGVRPPFAQALADGADDPAGADEPILVVVQLAGGNDGLNTVVPFADDAYRRARPRLALPRAPLIGLGDGLALHPSLAGLRALLDEGALAIVQGAGYEEQSRSHFRGIENWQTAADTARKGTDGWIGRWLAARCPQCAADAAVGLDVLTPRALLGRTTSGVTFSDPQQYRLLAGSFSAGGDDARSELFRGLNALAESGAPPALHAAARSGDPTLAFLQRVAFDAVDSAGRLLAAAAPRATADYGGGTIGRDLALVARMIGNGLRTRVYHVQHGNYDTHVDQLETHARLLAELGQAWAAFAADMKAQGNWERVTLLSFSEFGRRLAENANGGTDHGSAAPVFVAGGGIAPGLYGRAPGLAAHELRLGDPRFTTDYRSIYATVLERRLATESAPVLGRSYPLLDFA